MYDDLDGYVRFDLPRRFNEFDLLKTHFSRIINVFNNNVLPPYEILIHSSSICNLSCEWCIGSFVANKKSCDKLLKNNLFELDNMKKVVDGILGYKKMGKDYLTSEEKEYKVENVTFSGITGEPFIAKESILYAIDKLSSNGIRVGVFTNGTVIEPEMYDTVLKLGYVLISLDAGNKSTYSKLKCMGKNEKMFDKVIETIEGLSKLKQRINSNTDINIGYVINSYNYDELYDVAVILKNAGVHYLRFKTDIASLMTMSNEQREIAKNQIEKIRTELINDKFDIVEIHNVLDDRKKSREFSHCFIHYLIGNISADGNVYPCNYHPKPNGYYYSSAIENNFSSIWDNMLDTDIDKSLPDICPEVCDPFKNRANKLLEITYNIYKEKGLEYLKNCINHTDQKLNEKLKEHSI